MSEAPRRINVTYWTACIFFGILLCVVTLNTENANQFHNSAYALAFSESAKISAGHAYILAEQEQIRLNSLLPKGEIEINGYPAPVRAFAVTKNDLFFFPAGSVHHKGVKWTGGYLVNPENGVIKFAPTITCSVAQSAPLPK